MKSLLNFIIKFHYFILFVLIECFSIILVIEYNDYHRASFLNSSSHISGNVYKSFHSVFQYFDLKETNIELNETLASFQNKSKTSYKNNQVNIVEILDSLFTQQYYYIPGQVINNSINKQNNYITLNIGLRQGVKNEMGVISTLGIVGVVKDVSENYSSVISILNRNLKISAMIKHSGYFGTLYWSGDNYLYVTMDDLPNHISVNKGDTIITSGFSSMFPKGKVIGLVEEIDESNEGDFMSISVRLIIDFKKLSHVMVVDNLLREEQLNVEKKSNYD